MTDPYQPQQPNDPNQPQQPYSDPYGTPQPGSPGPSYGSQPPGSPGPSYGSQPGSPAAPYSGQPYTGQPYSGQEYGGQQPYGGQYSTPQYGANPYQPNYPPPQSSNTNVMAILSLVFAFVFAPVGIVLGHIAKKQIKERGEQGSGLATAGLVLSYIFTGLSLAFCCIGIIAAIATDGSSTSY